MKTLALVMMLGASSAVADEVVQADGGVELALPSLPSDLPQKLEFGQPAPSRGLFLPEAKAIEEAKYVKACTAEREELRKSAGVAWWVPVLIGVAALSVGVGVGVGVAKATGGPK